MYHVPLAVQCIYGLSNEGNEDGDDKEGSELPGLWERVNIACLKLYAGKSKLIGLN